MIRFNEAGGQINVIVPGVCVGAQSYWNAEATMMMSSRGLLIMTDRGAMVLTGKRALELSGCASAADELELGGFSAVMGANGQGQLHAPDLPSAYQTLYRFYQLSYRPAGQVRPPRAQTKDQPERDISQARYPLELGHGFERLGEIFSEQNRDRKRPFAVRPVMEALLDTDAPVLERWGAQSGAELAVVWHGRLDGHALTLIGVDNQAIPRVARSLDDPEQWSGGTLYPQASRKVARAINASRGAQPVIVLANLSGFDGSPESLRAWQLEFGAEIARAVVSFDRAIYFVVLSRYHGGAYVVFSKELNPRLQVIAIEGSYASVIGGVPAASIVFGRELRALAEQRGGGAEAQAEALTELAHRFDQTHDIYRAQRVGSIDVVLPLSALRAHLARSLSASS
jgi:acetyl-CoA carboxylase carboxyltransferase component